MRLFSFFLAAIAACLALTACGGGGGGTTPVPVVTAPPPVSGGGNDTSNSNVVALTLDAGSDGSAFNMPFVTVTICVPGTATCQAIDHVLVDTGSYGLRVLASALDSSVALPKVAAQAGNSLAECAPFVSGYAWGSVRTADVRIGGESAAGLPIQLVNDASIAAPPRACTTFGSNFGVGTGAKGILGIGVFAQDCGAGCTVSTTTGLYYGCDAANCVASTVPVASQVTNPVAFFATDNNGAVITLPPVPLTGATTAIGTLTFGIATRANNQLGGATVYAANGTGAVTTTFNGTRYSAFFDTGSNALFFSDPDLPQCDGGFYCPTTPQTLSAVVSSTNGASSTVTFTIEGLQSVSRSATAAPVGGNSSGLARSFDWGLPFFFGRTVFVALSGATTPAGPGPFWAF